MPQNITSLKLQLTMTDKILTLYFFNIQAPVYFERLDLENQIHILTHSPRMLPPCSIYFCRPCFE